MSTSFPRVLLLPLLLAAALDSVSAQAGVAGPEDIDSNDVPQHLVLVCMDTVRADRLGCYGYREHETSPNLDKLARRSLVFLDTSSAAGWTKPSVPTYFTGVYPVQHGVYEGSSKSGAGRRMDVLGVQVLTLAEAFQQNGFRTAAFIHNAQLREGSGFGQGFDVYVDRAGDAASIVTQALEWIDANSNRGRMLVYLHFLDAHWPYDVPQAYAERFAGGLDTSWIRDADWKALRKAVNDGERRLSDDERRSVEALYAGGIRYIDDELGRLFAGLNERGLQSSTAISVLADHGEEFGEHERIGHGHGLYENLLRVGWILHVPDPDPDRETGMVTTPVSLVDLYPTLLDACGLRSSVATEGVSQLSLPTRARPLFAEHKSPSAYQQSLRFGRYKLVRRFEPPLTEVAVVGLLQPGSRWEAEVALTPDGGLRGTQFKPRDEDPADPLEIKGRVSVAGSACFELAGITIKLDEETEFYGPAASDGRRPALIEGAPVKVRGRFRGGVVLAEKVKCYATADRFDTEIRGTVTVSEAGRVRLGTIWIAYDDDIRFKDMEQGRKRRRLTREQIVRVLEQGADAALRAGWTIRSTLYDLQADPGEHAPVAVVDGAGAGDRPEAQRLLTALDEMSRRLARSRLWRGTDEARLSEDLIEALRELGYVR